MALVFICQGNGKYPDRITKTLELDFTQAVEVYGQSCRQGVMDCSVYTDSTRSGLLFQALALTISPPR